MRRRFDRSENRQIRKVASLSAQALSGWFTLIGRTGCRLGRQCSLDTLLQLFDPTGPGHHVPRSFSRSFFWRFFGGSDQLQNRYLSHVPKRRQKGFPVLATQLRCWGEQQESNAL